MLRIQGAPLRGSGRASLLPGKVLIRRQRRSLPRGLGIHLGRFKGVVVGKLKGKSTRVPAAKHDASIKNSGGLEQSDFSYAHRASMQEFAEQLRRQALDGFEVLGRSITENSELPAEYKVDFLYAALEQISDSIIRVLIAAKNQSGPVQPRAARRDIFTIARELAEHLSGIEGSPTAALQRVFEAAVSAAYVRAEVVSLAGQFILRPPVPELTSAQVNAVIARGKERPWAERTKFHAGAFTWTLTTYGEWIPGLRQSHLALADKPLYGAFGMALSRARGQRPDWLDVPSDSEHHFRVAAYSNPLRALEDKRRKDRERKQAASAPR